MRAERMAGDCGRGEPGVAEGCRCCLEMCRCCLVSYRCSQLTSLFDHWTPPWKLVHSEDDSIANLLSRLTDVEISEQDGYPQKICHNCLNRFKNAFTFYYSVRYNNNKMRCDQLLNAPTMTYQQMVLASGAQKQNEWQIDNIIDTMSIKQEVVSEEEYSQTDIQTDHQIDIKIEPEEFVKQSSPRFFCRNVECNQQSQPPMSSPFSLESGCINTQTAHSDTDMDQAQWVKEELDSDEDSDVPLECLLCDKHFSTIRGLRAHVIGTHSYNNIRRKDNGNRSGGESHRPHQLQCTTASPMKTQSGNNTPAPCELCDSDFNRKTKQKTRTVRQLREEIDLEKPTNEDKTETHKCTQYEETFDNRINFEIPTEVSSNINEHNPNIAMQSEVLRKEINAKMLAEIENKQEIDVNLYLKAADNEEIIKELEIKNGKDELEMKYKTTDTQKSKNVEEVLEVSLMKDHISESNIKVCNAINSDILRKIDDFEEIISSNSSSVNIDMPILDFDENMLIEETNKINENTMQGKDEFSSIESNIDVEMLKSDNKTDLELSDVHNVDKFRKSYKNDFEASYTEINGDKNLKDVIEVDEILENDFKTEAVEDHVTPQATILGI